MKAMTIEQYLELTADAREAFDAAGNPAGERPAFPVTEYDAAEMLSDCGYRGTHAILEQLRKDGEVTATADAWGREAVEAAAEYLDRIQAFKFDVFGCLGFGLDYGDYMVAYLAACRRVRDEYPWVPAVGVFGGMELVSDGYFVKTIYPPHGSAPARVTFTLSDEIRVKLEAEKAVRP